MRRRLGKLTMLIAATLCSLIVSRSTAQPVRNMNNRLDNNGVGWAFQTLLLADGGEDHHRLGDAVAAHGDVVVAGARWQNNYAGAAYIFRRTGRTWAQEGKIVGSDTDESDFFGYALDVEGGTVVVGASGRGDGQNTTDAVYVFEYDGVGWHQQEMLFPPDLSPKSLYGSSVALEGDVLVVSDPFASLACDRYGETGAAYVYRRGPNGWTFFQKLTASDAYWHDHFGIDVAMDGNLMVIGAREEGHTGPGGSWWDGPGAVYVFEWNGSRWTETAKMAAPSLHTRSFGHSVAIANERIAIGSHGDYVEGFSGAGAVYLYERHDGQWTQVVRLTASDPDDYDLFGDTVSIDGDTVATTAHVFESDDVPRMAAYVFSRTELGWVQEVKLLGSGATYDGSFDGGVVLVGDTLLFGDSKDPTNGSYAGAVRVYHGFRNDCNGNGSADDQDIALLSSADCDADGIPDECQPDCNGNGVNDRCDVSSLSSTDCNSDGIPDDCQGDCNDNGVPDPCDLLAGTSPDCQGDGISDACQLTGWFENESRPRKPFHAAHEQSHVIPAPPLAAGDVRLTFTANSALYSFSRFVTASINDTTVGTVFVHDAHFCSYIDDTETLVVPANVFNAAVAGGDAVIHMTASPEAIALNCDRTFIAVATSYVTHNDCNGNAIPDDCEIAEGSSMDCQPNGVPDECEPDCNVNGMADVCDIPADVSADCQPNGTPDECDLDSGASMDCLGNGVPDECKADCNGNGTPDVCEIRDDGMRDCNSDGILDACASGLETWKLLADKPAARDSFGGALALHDDVLVVGAAGSDMRWDGAGAAHVFHFDGVQWKHVQTLLPLDLSRFDRFGRTVAVHGRWLFVGADSGSSTAAPGTVYVYRHADGAWKQAAKLAPCDDPDLRSFGQAMAVDAHKLVVGASLATGSGASRGAVYVYEYAGDEWAQRARLVSPSGRDEERFGADVALFEDMIAVGAYIHPRTGERSRIYLFEKTGDAWVERASLEPPEGYDASGFGVEIALGDGILFASARLDSTVREFSGAVYVFEQVANAWFPTDRLSLPRQFARSYFGESIHLMDSTRLVVASEDRPYGYGRCTVNVLDHDDSNWRLSARHFGSNATGREYRCTVAAMGQTVVLGDTRDDHAGEGSGAVYVFTDHENDCNANNVPDECELIGNDCNDNGLPDDCEDCNDNGLADSCEFDAGTAEDCNDNFIPDECEPDCNKNDIPDECDIASGHSQDVLPLAFPSGDGIPDECQVRRGQKK